MLIQDLLAFGAANARVELTMQTGNHARDSTVYCQFKATHREYAIADMRHANSGSGPLGTNLQTGS